MTIRDLSALFEDGLTFPGVPSRAHPGGRDYFVACPDAETGLWLRSFGDLGVAAAMGQPMTEAQRARLKLDDEQELSLQRIVLGTTYDQIVADGVSVELFTAIFEDAFTYYAVGPAIADLALLKAVADRAAQAGQGNPPARPNRAERRAKPAKSSPGTKSTTRSSGGSTSATAGSATPGPTRSRTSGPSKTSAPAKAQTKRAPKA